MNIGEWLKMTSSSLLYYIYKVIKNSEDPVTMVALANWPPGSLHIRWEQVTIFNKGIGFLCGLKFFKLHCHYILWRILIRPVCAWCCKYATHLLSKFCQRISYELLNIHACSFLMFWNRGRVYSEKNWRGVRPRFRNHTLGYGDRRLKSYPW